MRLLYTEIINGVGSKVLKEKMAITRPNAASHIYLRQSRHCSYSTVFPLRCRDDAISCTRFFYAHTSYTANFARVEKLHFSPAFLYTRFNFFYVKYHASAACHGEINFSKLPSTRFAREKLSRLKYYNIPLRKK